MRLEQFEYAGLLLLSWTVPFLYLSIHYKFLKPWGLRLIQPSVILTAVPFLIWDWWAISSGQWSYNTRYVTGWYLGVAPVEEILFFLFIPQACLLIWVLMKKYPSAEALKEAAMHHIIARRKKV